LRSVRQEPRRHNTRADKHVSDNFLHPGFVLEPLPPLSRPITDVEQRVRVRPATKITLLAVSALFRSARRRGAGYRCPSPGPNSFKASNAEGDSAVCWCSSRWCWLAVWATHRCLACDPRQWNRDRTGEDL